MGPATPLKGVVRVSVAAAPAAAATVAAATALGTETATAASTTTAAAAFFTGTSFVYCNGPSHKVLAIQFSYGFLCFVIRSHFYKAKPLTAASIAVNNHFGACYFA